MCCIFAGLVCSACCALLKPDAEVLSAGFGQHCDVAFDLFARSVGFLGCCFDVWWALLNVFSYCYYLFVDNYIFFVAEVIMLLVYEA